MERLALSKVPWSRYKTCQRYASPAEANLLFAECFFVSSRGIRIDTQLYAF